MSTTKIQITCPDGSVITKSTKRTDVTHASLVNIDGTWKVSVLHASEALAHATIETSKVSPYTRKDVTYAVAAVAR